MFPTFMWFSVAHYPLVPALTRGKEEREPEGLACFAGKIHTLYPFLPCSPISQHCHLARGTRQVQLKRQGSTMKREKQGMDSGGQPAVFETTLTIFTDRDVY